jgi:myo-inositol-1(or 4)-monophosphatase
MSDALDFAMQTAHQAGQLLCEYRGRLHSVSHKLSDIDLVTEADLASEALIVEAIRTRFPGAAILSEEGLGASLETASAPPAAPSSLETVWLVDPLDGTVNYAHGYPHWSVTLAMAAGGSVVLGVTHDPLRAQTFWAERGKGAWCDGSRLRVSTVERLGDALLATGFPYSRATNPDNNLAEFSALMPRVRGVRRAGSAALDLAHVAAGWLDGYWEAQLNPWDWAAGVLMLDEAGGTVTDMDGTPFTLAKDRIAASNGRLHAELLAALIAARPFRESGPAGS